MTQDVRVRPCGECGWPALSGTRRCPYCRVTMPASRPAISAWRRQPARWLAAGGAFAIMLAVALLWLALDWRFALCAAVLALAPGAFLLLLHQRTAARVRRLSRRSGALRSAARRARRQPPSPSDNQPSDSSRR